MKKSIAYGLLAFAILLNSATIVPVYAQNPEVEAISAEVNEPAMSNFTDKNSPLTFSDVDENAWYYNAVSESSKLGIINGIGDGTFNPEGQLTYAQALSLTVKTHSIYWGTEEPRQSTSGHWATNILDYAKKHEIVDSDADYNLDAVCTRGDMAELFCGTLASKDTPIEDTLLPGGVFEATNALSLAPEQFENPNSSEKAIQVLYQAGVFIGDNSGFRKDDPVSRAEAAAIILRVAKPADRQVVTEDTYNTTSSADEEYTTEVPVSDNVVESSDEGFYVNIDYAGVTLWYNYSDLGFDTMTFTLKDSTGNVLSSVDKTLSDLESANGYLKLKFDYTDYKLNDTLVLELPQSDLIKVYRSGSYTEAIEATDSYFKFVLTNQNVFDDNGNIIGAAVLGTKETNLNIAAFEKTPSTQKIYLLESGTETPISNVTVTLQGGVYTHGLSRTSNSEGIIEIPTDATGNFYVISNDINWVTSKASVLLIGDYSTKTFVYLRRNTQEAIDSFNASLPKDWANNFNIALETPVLTDLNSSFANVQIKLTSGTLEYVEDLSLGINSISIPLGTYNIEVLSAEYCNIDIPSTITVANNTNISVSVTPKYTLEIYKQDESGMVPCKFVFVNIPNTDTTGYMGGSETVFAVIPGQSIIVKDTETQYGHIVNISDDSPITTLNLAQ